MRMRLVQTLVIGSIVTAGVGAPALAEVTSIDSLQVLPRQRNNFPDSNLTVNNLGGLNGITFDERDFGLPGPTGSFANTHEAFFSADGGSSAFVFERLKGFEIFVDVSLEFLFGDDVPGPEPRKEAGLIFRSTAPNGDERTGQFLITSDAEVAAFGAGMPFQILRPTMSEDGYMNGETVNMGVRYVPGDGTDANPATIEYIYEGDRFGPLIFGNVLVQDGEEDENIFGLWDGTTIALKAQYAVNLQSIAGGDFATTMFSNIEINEGWNAAVADWDRDGDVDAFDLGIWQTGFGTTEGGNVLNGDADGDGDVDAFDLGLWQTNFGTVTRPGGNGVAAIPEPASVAAIGAIALLGLRRNRTTDRPRA